MKKLAILATAAFFAATQAYAEGPSVATGTDSSVSGSNAVASVIISVIISSTSAPSVTSTTTTDAAGNETTNVTVTASPQAAQAGFISAILSAFGAT